MQGLKNDAHLLVLVHTCSCYNSNYPQCFLIAGRLNSLATIMKLGQNVSPKCLSTKKSYERLEHTGWTQNTYFSL